MRYTSNRRSRNNKGGRNRGSNHNGGNSKSHVYDSNGPDVRVRGTAFQICEKYMTLAKDASTAGDIVLAENYYQHAEHYQRIINSWNEQNAASSDSSNESSFDNEDDENESGDESLAQAPQQRRNPKPQNDRGRNRQETSTDSSEDDEEDLGLPQSLVGGTKGKREAEAVAG